MRRFFFIATAILICFFIEIIISTNLVFLKIRPNLLLLATIFFTVYLGLPEGIFSAAISGILRDALNLNAGAINIFILVICVLAVYYLKKYTYRESTALIFITILAACLINSSLNYFLGFFMKGVYVGVAFLFLAVLEIILTSLLAPSVFSYLKKCALKFYI